MNNYRFPKQCVAPEPLDEYVNRSIKPDIEYMKEDGRFTAMILNEMNATGNPDGVYQIRRHYARGKSDGLCPTLTANMGAGGHNVPFISDGWGIRKLTVTECAKLQGFDELEDLFPDEVPDNARYKMIGNAVSQTVAASLATQALNLLAQR